MSDVISTDDLKLEKTQNVRDRIISILSDVSDEELKRSVEDKTISKVLLTSMKDMDDQILKKQKIAVDKSASETNATMIAEISKAIADKALAAHGRTDYFMKENNSETTIPVPDPSKFRGATIVDGEFEQAENNEDIDSFMGRMGKAARKAAEIDKEVTNIINGDEE